MGWPPIQVQDLGSGGGRPLRKSGLRFDYILGCLQGELQKSWEIGVELHMSFMQFMK